MIALNLIFEIMDTIEDVEMSGIVLSKGSKEILNEEKGTVRVLHLVKITKANKQYPNMLGLEVTSSRTLLNSKEEEKEPVNIDDEVILYMSVVDDGRGPKPFFNIGTGLTGASDEDILTAIGMSASQEG